MRYTEFRPSPFLRRYIESYWLLRDEAPSSPAAAHRIMPDGCVELIFNLADPFRRIHPDGQIETQPTVLVAGQMRSCALIKPAGRVTLLGVRFRPAGALPFFHVPLHELTDHIAESSAVLGSWVIELQERLAAALARPHWHRQLENALHGRLRQRRSSDPMIEEAVRRILASAGRVQVERLFANLGMGARQIERKFQLLVGLRPKMLARIIRFQNLLTLAGHESQAWGAVAQHAGYYDQAHLIHDFQQFAGQPPSAFLLEQTELSAFFTRQHRKSVFYNTTS